MTARVSSMIDEDMVSGNVFETTWVSNVSDELDRRMVQEYEKIIKRKKEAEMRSTPLWLLVIILFFVYDDIWFSEAEYPFTHNILGFFICFVLSLYAMGKGKSVTEFIHVIISIIPFINKRK